MIGRKECECTLEMSRRAEGGMKRELRKGGGRCGAGGLAVNIALWHESFIPKAPTSTPRVPGLDECLCCLDLEGTRERHFSWVASLSGRSAIRAPSLASRTLRLVPHQSLLASRSTTSPLVPDMPYTLSVPCRYTLLGVRVYCPSWMACHIKFIPDSK
jgi:hypothetical protein